MMPSKLQLEQFQLVSECPAMNETHDALCSGPYCSLKFPIPPRLYNLELEWLMGLQTSEIHPNVCNQFSTLPYFALNSCNASSAGGCCHGNTNLTASVNPTQGLFHFQHEGLPNETLNTEGSDHCTPTNDR